MGRYIVRVGYGDDKFLVEAKDENEASYKASRIALLDQKEHPVAPRVYDVRPVPMKEALDEAGKATERRFMRHYTGEATCDLG